MYARMEAMKIFVHSNRDGGGMEGVGMGVFHGLDDNRIRGKKKWSTLPLPTSITHVHHLTTATI